MGKLLGIGAYQMEVYSGYIDKNLKNLRSQVRQIAYYSPWVKLIVAPELCFQGMSSFKTGSTLLVKTGAEIAQRRNIVVNAVTFQITFHLANYEELIRRMASDTGHFSPCCAGG